MQKSALQISQLLKIALKYLSRHRMAIMQTVVKRKNLPANCASCLVLVDIHAHMADGFWKHRQLTWVTGMIVVQNITIN